MATEAVSPYIRRPVLTGDEGTTRSAARAAIPDTFFAFGGEAVSRPSATGRYLISDLEMELEAGDLAYELGTVSPRRRQAQIEFDKDSGQVIVRLVVPEEAAELALSEMQQAGRNIWDLSDLSERLAQSAVYEASQMAPKAIAEAVKMSPQAIAEAVQAAPRTISEAVRMTPKSIAEAVKGMSVVPQRARGMPTPVAAPSTAPEIVEPLPDDASIMQLTTRLSELTGLPDDELAQLFLGRASRERVSREHYQRWRTGRKENSTKANRRRMWFLVRLFEQLAQAEVAIQDWVRNASSSDHLTPFDLLKLGRFDEVEYLAARMVPAPEPQEVISAEGRPVLLDQGLPSFTPRSEEPTTDLVFDEGDDWVEIEDDEDEMDDE